MVGKCVAKQSSVELTILQLDWDYTDQVGISYELLVTATDALLGTMMVVHAIMQRLQERS